ncbi:MAG: FecCD family ABC transporter permease [Candidatus Bruticola sp.]
MTLKSVSQQHKEKELSRERLTDAYLCRLRYANWKRLSILLLSAALLLIAAAAASFFGAVTLPWSDFVCLITDPARLPEASRIIIFELRWPRILMAILSGASLSLAGCGFQAILRNPLADPYIVGTSSGASLGATLAIVFHIPNFSPYLPSVPIMAFAGAVIAMLAVYRLAKADRGLPVGTFLLAGVIVGSFTSAVVSLLMSAAKQDLQRVILWMMGTLDQADFSSILMTAPYLLIGFAVLCWCAVPLNMLCMGEEHAKSLGINTEALKLSVVAACSLMTAASVAVAGMIGFLGLVVPHVTRLLTGPDHRLLLPAAAINGASFLVIADIMSRTIIAPQELPVGVLTALVGAPFFFFILKREHR